MLLPSRELQRAIQKRDRLAQAERYLEEALPHLVDLPTTHGDVKQALANVARNLAKANLKVKALTEQEEAV